MRNIFETAKKAQMAPVRGRVKAMMAQPRAIPQARKTARQTTGFKQGGAFLPLRGGVTTAKAFRGSEGFKQSQKLQKKLLGTTVGKRKLSLEEKLRMQAKGVINKKTGRLIPAHEAVMKGSSSKQVNFMAKKGYNPKLFKGKPKPGPLATKQDVKKSLKETKLEAKYFKEMKAKGIKKSGGVIQKQAGGKVTPMSHGSEAVKWFKEKWGGTKKGKPHSTREGRIAAGERALRRNAEYWDKKREEEKKKRRPGPQAPARPRPKAGPPAGMPQPKGERKMIPDKEEPGMYVKKGGVVQKVFLGKLMSKLGIGKQRTGSRQEALAGQDYKRMRPEPTHQQTLDLFKKKLGYQKGGVMEKGKDENRQATKSVQALLDQLLKKGKKPSKPHGERQDPVGKKKGGKVDKKWIQKAVDPKHKGYCTPMTKPTCTPARKRLAKLFKSKAKKGWANGGTVVMPTVGKDSFMRTYKHGAVISPRPRPTVPHGSRMRGTGIAKRGW